MRNGIYTREGPVKSVTCGNAFADVRGAFAEEPAPTESAAGEWPFVSVLVPVRNEERHLERTLQALLTQDYPAERYEVIVADGQSEDGTAAIVRRWQERYAQLHLVANPRRWSSAGRNAAWRRSRGEYIVIVDGHCHLPDRCYLRHVVEAFATSGADCLGRPQPLEVPNPTPFQEAVALARRSWLGHNPDSDIFADTPRFIPAQNTAVAYRREVFHQVGLFDETFDACEDVEFNTRVDQAGLRCYFAPALRVHYEPRRSFGALFYQLRRYGTGRARLAFKHPQALTLPAVLPPLLLVGLLASLLAAAFWPNLLLLLGLAAAGYLLLLVAVSLVVGRGRSWRVRGRVPLAFVAIHFGFAWGFLEEVVRQMGRRVRGVVQKLRVWLPMRRAFQKLRAIGQRWRSALVRPYALDQPSRSSPASRSSPDPRGPIQVTAAGGGGGGG
jgi:cellulose synthase/poly-beta-1,6-N-acetylglucosamine synthase-like glycosyltransferase